MANDAEESLRRLGEAADWYETISDPRRLTEQQAEAFVVWMQTSRDHVAAYSDVVEIEAAMRQWRARRSRPK